MNLDTELAIKQLLEDYLAKHPTHDTLYIKILDNNVIVTDNIPDLYNLKRYPNGEIK